MRLCCLLLCIVSGFPTPGELVQRPLVTVVAQLHNENCFYTFPDHGIRVSFTPRGQLLDFHPATACSGNQRGLRDYHHLYRTIIISEISDCITTTTTTTTTTTVFPPIVILGFLALACPALSRRPQFPEIYTYLPPSLLPGAALDPRVDGLPDFPLRPPCPGPDLEIFGRQLPSWGENLAFTAEIFLVRNGETWKFHVPVSGFSASEESVLNTAITRASEKTKFPITALRASSVGREANLCLRPLDRDETVNSWKRKFLVEISVSQLPPSAFELDLVRQVHAALGGSGVWDAPLSLGLNASLGQVAGRLLGLREAEAGMGVSLRWLMHKYEQQLRVRRPDSKSWRLHNTKI